MENKIRLFDSANQYKSELDYFIERENRFPLFLLFLISRWQPTTIIMLSDETGLNISDTYQLVESLSKNNWVTNKNTKIGITRKGRSFLKNFGLTKSAKTRNIIPTLFIGLGNTGDVVARLFKKLLEDEIEPEYLPLISFIVFNVSTNKQNSNENDGVHYEYLNSGENRTFKDLIESKTSQHNNEKWFPFNKEINPKNSNHVDGNPYRQFGRLALYNSLTNQTSKIVQVLTEKAQELENKRQDYHLFTEGLAVHIVSSINGGTGTGMILDMGFLIRNILGKIGVDHRIGGHLFVPKLAPISLESSVDFDKARMYQTLREIDRFTRSAPPVKSNPLYQNKSTNKPIYKENQPFDLVRVYTPNTYGQYQVAAEIKNITTPNILALPNPDSEERLSTSWKYIFSSEEK